MNEDEELEILKDDFFMLVREANPELLKELFGEDGHTDDDETDGQA